MPDPALLVGILTATFLLAGLVKGVIGMGLPTLAIALLGLVMPPVQAAALLVVPSFVTNLWQFAAGPALGAVVRRFATLMLAVFLGTPTGIGLLTSGDTSFVTAALGSVLALYGVVGLLAVRFTVSPRWEPWLSPLAGFLTGAVTGATGVLVIPAVPYFSALRLDKEELMQALGLSFTVSTVALAVALAASGRFDAPVAGLSLFALAPALAGMYVGQRVRYALRPEVFRRWFFAGLIILGAYMLARALAVAPA